MWDEDVEDTRFTRGLPFEGDAFSYIEINPSDLVASVSDGPASKVTRGKGQFLTLEGNQYTYDPDYPELGVMHSLTELLHACEPEEDFPTIG